ncbi:MAG: DUF1565 domain-containing protein [Oscillospiraceae bacterium]|nr:DUF1565 domain-containing protein [Oscillospiraceae bacterium]
MKRYFKLLSLVLALCMLIGPIPVSAAESDSLKADDSVEIAEPAGQIATNVGEEGEGNPGNIDDPEDFDNPEYIEDPKDVDDPEDVEGAVEVEQIDPEAALAELAEEEEGEEEEEEEIELLPLDVEYSISDSKMSISVDGSMQMTVYRIDGSTKTPMTTPIENLGDAGATAVNTAPWKNGLPWSTGTGTGGTDLHTNSAKLLSPKSGYVTTWTGSGSRMASGNDQYEALLTDEFLATGATYGQNIDGHFGKGDRLTVTGVNYDLGLERRLVIETSYAVPGAAAISTYYKYIGTDAEGITITKFVENNFKMEDVPPAQVNGNNVDAGIWTFQGGATSWGRDTVMPVFDTMGINGATNFTQGNASYNSPNTNAQQRNNWFWTSSACIPYNNYYGTNLGIGIGSGMPYHVFGLELPTRGSGITNNHNTAYAWVGWPGKTLTPTTPAASEYIGTSIITVHAGDYYEANRLYSSAMAQVNLSNFDIYVNEKLANSVDDFLVLPSSADMPDWAWAPIGESWGYGTGFSVTNLMDKVNDYVELGIKSLTLDAHWFIPSSNSGGAANYNLLATRWQPVLTRLQDYAWQDPALAAYYAANPLPAQCTTHTEAKKVVRGYNDFFKDHGINVVAWTVGAGIQPNIATAALSAGVTREDKLHLFNGLNGKAAADITQADIDSVTAQNATGGFTTNDGSRYPCFANPQFLEVFAKNYAEYIFGELGFSGMKIDSTYGNQLCYATGHGHDGDPEANLRSYGTFYQRFYDYANLIRGATTTLGGPIVDRQRTTVIMHCACGSPMNFFSWGGTNRPVPGDSVGARQQRYMVKSYKGFYDATFPVAGDHLYLSKLNTTNEGQRAGPPDYISHMGAGAVFDTKFRTQRYNTVSGNGEFSSNQDMLYPGQTGYTTITGTGTPGTVNRTYRWGDFIRYFGLYNDLLISKAQFMNLYKYGFDYPEAYAYKVNEFTFYHSFYATTNATGAGFKSGLVNDPWGSAYYSANTYSGNVELRGLNANTFYYITNIETGKQYMASSDANGSITLGGISFRTGAIFRTSSIGTGSIFGTVTVGGAVVPGAELKLLYADGTPVAGISPTATDLDGFYCFPVVPSGNYIIHVTVNKGADGKPYPGVAESATHDHTTDRFDLLLAAGIAGEYQKDIAIPRRYNVNYNANGGSGASDIQVVYEWAKFTTYSSDYFTPPLNKVFVEWNTAADGSGISYAAGAEYNVENWTEGLTLYAIWRWRTTYVYHVAVTGNNAGDGSAANPWATVTYALTQMGAGDTLLIHAGRYEGRYTINGELSGLYKEAPTVIKGAGDGEAILDGGATGTVITINNCGDLVIEGLTVTNATSNGIMYYAQNNAAANARVDYTVFNIETDDPALSPFANVVIRNNKVYNINTSAFAIGFYGQNVRAPIADLVIDGNEVFCNRNYWSEGVTLNGNIDRFDVCNNVIYNNNNIGICMIGFENTARLPAAPGLGDGLLGRHKYDNARNGKCYNNVVYGSVVINNEAYWFPDGDTLGTRQGPEEGEYSRCCDGIYVCGGQNIEIFNNLVFDCDIGIEISTEHEYPDFWIENIYVHDNIIANNVGWNGLSIGGQSMDEDFEQQYVSGIAGQTKNSRVENNILYGNIVNMNIQHSENNTIKNNIIYGGGAAVMDWLDVSLHDANNIGANVWYNDPAFGVSDADYYLELSRISQFADQIIVTAPPLANPKGGDFTVTYAGAGGPFGTNPNNWAGVDYKGDAWKFEMDFLKLYAQFSVANDEIAGAVKFLETLNIFDYEEAVAGYDNLRDYLNDKLYKAGFVNSTIPYVLKVWAPRSGRVDGWAPSGANNGPDPYGLIDLRNNRAGNNMLPDSLKHENTMDHANGYFDSAVLFDQIAAAGGKLEYRYYVEVITRFNNGKSFTQAATLNGLVIKAGGGAVVPAASVKKLSGNQNELTISITEYYTNGLPKNVITVTFMIANNSAGTYKVGKYSVYVDTKGNDQIRDCRITGGM